MQRSRALGAMFFGIVALVAGSHLSSWQHTLPVAAQATAATPNVAVGPQYDTTHIYVAPQDFDRFVASLIATSRRLKRLCRTESVPAFAIFLIPRTSWLSLLYLANAANAMLELGFSSIRDAV
jgi:hypothetical protein